MKVGFKLRTFNSPGEWYALWDCLNTGTHSGYRLRMENTGHENWKAIIERVTGGIPTLLGQVAVGLSEAANHQIELRVGSGKVGVYVEGSLRLQVSDATYTEGRVGFEGIGNGPFVASSFEINGTIVDGLNAEPPEPVKVPFIPANGPNAAKWTVLPWVADRGYYSQEGEPGWLSSLEEKLSGNYYNVESFEAGEWESVKEKEEAEEREKAHEKEEKEREEREKKEREEEESPEEKEKREEEEREKKEKEEHEGESSAITISSVRSGAAWHTRGRR